MVYGPYEPAPPGRYVAVFRLKRTGPGNGALVTLDTCVGGGSPVTAERKLTVEDLPNGEYRAVPLAFTHPGGPLETRVQWIGAASLSVDSIILWQVANSVTP